MFRRRDLPISRAEAKRLRWWTEPAFVLASILLIAYAGSYFHLSRRGLREAELYHMHSFFFVPLQEVAETKDLSRHFFRMRLYAPLSWVDRVLFDTKVPCRGVMWGWSREPVKESGPSLSPAVPASPSP